MKRFPKRALRLAATAWSGFLLAGCVGVPYDPPPRYYGYAGAVYGPPALIWYHRERRR